MAAAIQTAAAQAPPAPPPPDPAKPVYVVSYIDVIPSQKKSAIKLLKQFATSCAKEAGNQRCELVQRMERQNMFVLLEVWKDKASIDGHAGAATTKTFRDTLKPMQESPYDERIHIGLAVLAPAAAPTGRVVYVVTHVDVIPPRIADAVSLLSGMADSSRKDTGNLRFDVLQQPNRPNHFTVVEVWSNRTNVEAHQVTPAMIAYRDKIQPAIGALYDERLYKFPD